MRIRLWNLKHKTLKERKTKMLDHPVLRAAEITFLPNGVSQSEFVAQILKDNFVNQLVMEYLVERFAAEAIAAKAHPLEKKALRKRFKVEPSDKPLERSAVQWGIVNLESGKIAIKAWTNTEEALWSGASKDILTFRFKGEQCPADVAAVYTLRAGDGVNDPEWQAAQRDYVAKEEAKHKHADSWKSTDVGLLK